MILLVMLDGGLAVEIRRVKQHGNVMIEGLGRGCTYLTYISI